MKLGKNDPETQSKNIPAENIETLKQLFPSIVEEGKVNFDALRQLLGDTVVNEKEYYRFTWPGKHQARQEALKTSTGTLRPAKEDSVDWDTTQNLYIEGDNLEVLKLLQKSYFNKVKMIYIDPPYNTGKDFVYKDKYGDNLSNFLEKFNRTDEEGNVISSETNNEGNAKYHSNWLNMMYPRLQLARTLLKDDGVIFISIDDNEVHNLRRICDEIFGEENFVADIIWNSTKSVTNTAIISTSHTHNLVYFKNIEYFKSNRDEFRLQDDGEGFNNPDNDPRGDWKADPFQVGGWRPNQQYEIINPNTGVVYKPNTNCSWKNDYETFQKLLKDNRIVFGKSGEAGPLRKRFKFEAIKRGKVAKTIWDDVETTTNGTQLLKNMFNGKSLFENPKPVSFIKKILELGSHSKDNYILDFFSGSATTAHAVMDLNKEDMLESKDGNRKYIMVQLPEPTEEKSEAYKAGYKTIAEIGKERIRRAASQIKDELKDKPEVLEKLDLGFKVFKLDSSNIKTWDNDPEELENNLFQDEVIKDNRTAEDVLYEVLIKYGLDLTLPIEEITIDNKTIYSIGAGQLIFCLEDGVTRDTAQAIIDWAKENEVIDPKIVFKDSGFTNDVEKTNIIQLFKTNEILDVKSI